MNAVYLTAGVVLLVLGAEILVRHASALADRLRVPPLVIGLTIVAFGTSAPEMAVSTMASLAGQPDLALGNVVGSNIYNVLLILGASALVTPLVISAQLVRVDVPLMIGVSLLALLMALDGAFGRIDGLVLVAGIVVYTLFQVRQGQQSAAAQAAEPAAGRPALLHLGLVLVGLALLVLGSRWFLDGAVGVAQLFGISELVIGLTIVAAGTSLPETATSIVAAVRGERDIAVGNVVGSNVFNILAVLGVSAVVAEEGIPVAPSSTVFDIPVMIAAAVACLPIFFTRNVITRWQGALFLAYYVAYVSYLILDAQQHDALTVFGSVMLYFAFPLTAITFGTIAVRRLLAGRSTAERI